MANLVTQTVTLTGVVLTYVSASSPNDIITNNDGRSILRVKNGSGGSVTVTVDSTRPCDQGFDHDNVVVVGAGAEAAIGPFPTVRFGRSVTVSYSSITSVTVAVEGVGAQ